MYDTDFDLIVPEPLKPGDAIGIAAPAGPFDREKFNNGVHILEGQGYEVVVPEQIFDRRGYLAGSDERRAESFNQLLGHPRIRAVICARGGYGSMRILSRIDYDLITENPKTIVGFSDITALLVSIFENTGVATFHGPVVTTIANADAPSLANLFTVLTKHGAYMLEPASPSIIAEGVAEGRIIGGNLTTLCHLIGTSFEPSFRDRILFFEDVGEAAYRIDRMLVHMKMAGRFDGVRGIILGDFHRCAPLAEIYALFGEVFRDMAIPILAGFAIGHGQTNLTIPFGWYAVLDTDSLSLSLSPDR